MALVRGNDGARENRKDPKGEHCVYLDNGDGSVAIKGGLRESDAQSMRDFWEGEHTASHPQDSRFRVGTLDHMPDGVPIQFIGVMRKEALGLLIQNLLY